MMNKIEFLCLVFSGVTILSPIARFRIYALLVFPMVSYSLGFTAMHILHV